MSPTPHPTQRPGLPGQEDGNTRAVFGMWRVAGQTRRGGRFDNWRATGIGRDSAGNFLLLRGVGGRADGICDEGKDGPALYTPLAVLSGILCGSGGRGRVQRDDGFSGKLVGTGNTTQRFMICAGCLGGCLWG